MKILAIESSGKACGAAVLENGKILCEISICNEHTHSAKLMPMVEECLEKANVKIGEIDCFAVTTGPGSFTGLRIGICTIKGLAQPMNKRVAAVSSLESMARAIDAERIAVFIDARNENVYAAYLENGALKEDTGHYAEMIEKLGVKEDALFLGDGAKVLKEKILEICPKASFGGDSATDYPQAGTTAKIAYEKAIKGDTISAFELEANYMRPSQAERQKNGNKNI